MWLVDMRHDATHASIPGLPLLRSATHYALAWIKVKQPPIAICSSGGMALPNYKIRLFYIEWSMLYKTTHIRDHLAYKTTQKNPNDHFTLYCIAILIIYTGEYDSYNTEAPG